MPAYMFLLYGDPAEGPSDEAGVVALMAKHAAFMAQARESGATIVSSEALESGTTATTIRNRAGAEAMVTDGPFAETKEELGGYYLIQARDLDHALGLAKLVPEPNVEVRPVMPTE
jgi:hypothetical protein